MNVITDSVFVGDSDNLGTPRSDVVHENGMETEIPLENFLFFLEKNTSTHLNLGRSRPNKAWVYAAIVGYRSYDAEGGDVAVNLR
jgi:hypothetical protein